MNNHRLQAGHTWEEMHAFLTSLKPATDIQIYFNDSGRCKFRYVLKENRHTPIAESFFSLRKGWQYALPPGIKSGVNNARQAAIAFSVAINRI